MVGHFSRQTCAIDFMCARSPDRVRLYATPWTIAHQAPLSMTFSRQKYWSGCHALFQEIFLTQGSSPGLICLLHWQVFYVSYIESSRKTSVSALLTMPKPLTMWITTNCGKFLKRWEYKATWLASWEICIQVRKQQLELDMEQQTGSKLGKEYIKAVWEIPGWMKHKLELRLPGEISITSNIQMTPPWGQTAKKD